ncbi:FAD-dependent oxidoreductase [Bradyrhizobium pachyrhizi]|uniref:FAD-dependent oxidoreductase n=1 Tax=Bradyrhizobium pachyrhizi TaxID=280333 RepID=UPI003D36F542
MTTAQTCCCDVLIVGAGAAGLAAAVTAARNGLKVIIAEKAPYYGGTSAVSGGWVWVPCSAQARAAGIVDDLEKARTYLRGEMGQRYSAAHIDAYLETAPRALDFFARESDLSFELGPLYADYHPEAPGGMAGGRALVALPYDGRKLGREIGRLKPPVRETTFLGMAVGSGKELKHFFNVTRSVVSAAYVAMLLGRFFRDKLIYGRGMRLTNGNALVARLARTAFALGVELRTEAPVLRLLGDSAGVTGAVVVESGGEVEILVHRGVILTAGGFAHNAELRKRLYPHVRAGSSHSSAVDPHVTGDTFRMASEVGGEIVDDYSNAAAWVPLSLVPRGSGAAGPFPHFIDRAKPGVVAVTRAGQRFVNEAVSYHDFVQALQAVTPQGAEAECWLVADHPTIRKYGLGHVKPFPVPLKSALRSGYLKRGATLADLADECGIEPQAFEATVSRYNATAQWGEDPEYRRGSTAYNRFLGDATHTLNPCVGPIRRGPFYAIRLVAGDLGTFAGIRTDEAARVLTASGEVIPGLYAAGNDAASIMAGTYPGAGITLGPAITFGYIAALDAAGRPGGDDRPVDASSAA